MTPMAELDFDRTMAITVPVEKGETIDFHGIGGLGAWKGVVEFATDDDAIVLVTWSDGMDPDLPQQGQRILFSWPS